MTDIDTNVDTSPEAVERMAAELNATSQEICDWNGQTMKNWDAWRAMIFEGDTSSWPRDCFESLMVIHADQMEQAAALLRQLAKERDEALERVKGFANGNNDWRIAYNKLSMERDELAAWKDQCCQMDGKECQNMKRALTAAANHEARNAALEEAAQAAEGPVFIANPKTGEASLRGTEEHNWSVPQPIAGYTCSNSYGLGRTAAAAAIRALKDKPEELSKGFAIDFTDPKNW
jgi:hypothetical protein